MAKIKPFLCIRPAEGKAAKIAALNYCILALLGKG